MSNVMNTIEIDSENCGSFFGELASKYAYKPELRNRIDELVAAAHRSSNRHFVLEGTITRAAQSTLSGALHYMKPEYVLVSIKV